MLWGQTMDNKTIIREENPYKDNGCPICREHAVTSCRCMGPHTMEQLMKGHGLTCKNGHTFNREGLAYDKSKGFSMEVIRMESN